MINFSTLATVIEFDPIELKDGSDTFKFRLEIFKRNDRRSAFYGRMIQIQRLRVQPTFPQSNGRPQKGHQCDEQVFHIDQDIFNQPIEGKSESEIVEAVINHLNSVFGLQKQK